MIEKDQDPSKVREEVIRRIRGRFQTEQYEMLVQSLTALSVCSAGFGDIPYIPWPHPLPSDPSSLSPYLKAFIGPGTVRYLRLFLCEETMKYFHPVFMPFCLVKVLGHFRVLNSNQNPSFVVWTHGLCISGVMRLRSGRKLSVPVFFFRKTIGSGAAARESLCIASCGENAELGLVEVRRAFLSAVSEFNHNPSQRDEGIVSKEEDAIRAEEFVGAMKAGFDLQGFVDDNSFDIGRVSRDEWMRGIHSIDFARRTWVAGSVGLCTGDYEPHLLLPEEPSLLPDWSRCTLECGMLVATKCVNLKLVDCSGKPCVVSSLPFATVDESGIGVRVVWPSAGSEIPLEPHWERREGDENGRIPLLPGGRLKMHMKGELDGVDTPLPEGECRIEIVQRVLLGDRETVRVLQSQPVIIPPTIGSATLHADLRQVNATLAAALGPGTSANRQ
jgi:hypothetical protein